MSIAVGRSCSGYHSHELYERLYEAAEKRDLETIREIVESGDLSDVDHPDNDGVNVLLHAAAGGSLPIVKYLVDTAGADINYHDKHGFCAIIVASYLGWLDIVKYCMTHPSRKELKTGQVPLIAAASKSLAIVKYLVEHHHVDVNARGTGGYTALMTAARFSKPRIVHYLVRHGASVTIKNDHGLTVFDMNPRHTHEEAEHDHDADDQEMEHNVHKYSPTGSKSLPFLRLPVTTAPTAKPTPTPTPNPTPDGHAPTPGNTATPDAPLSTLNATDTSDTNTTNTSSGSRLTREVSISGSEGDGGVPALLVPWEAETTDSETDNEWRASTARMPGCAVRFPQPGTGMGMTRSSSEESLSSMASSSSSSRVAASSGSETEEEVVKPSSPASATASSTSTTGKPTSGAAASATSTSSSSSSSSSSSTNHGDVSSRRRSSNNTLRSARKTPRTNRLQPAPVTKADIALAIYTAQKALEQDTLTGTAKVLPTPAGPDVNTNFRACRSCRTTCVVM